MNFESKPVSVICESEKVIVLADKHIHRKLGYWKICAEEVAALNVKLGGVVLNDVCGHLNNDHFGQIFLIHTSFDSWKEVCKAK
jgi:hypothetical protein